MSADFYSESDPVLHTARFKQEFRDLIEDLRSTIEHVREPQAKALFETSAEVLGGLMKAFEDYENKSEPAWIK
jgi:hypothetical protein